MRLRALAHQRAHFLRPGLYRIVIFGRWYSPGVREVQNGFFLKAAQVQNRSFLSVRTGPDVGEAGFVQHRKFWAFGTSPCMSGHVTSRRVASCCIQVTSRRVMLHHDMSCHVMSCHVMSLHVRSHHVTSRRVTLHSRHVASRHVAS